MSLFRDSWEVWRRKVNETIGNVEPIKSANVTYSNTNSGLNATNAQSAIDEVADDLSGLTSKIGNWKIVSLNNEVTTTGDGAKKYNVLIDEVLTELQGVISNLSDNQYLIPKRLTIYGVASFIPKMFYYKNTDTLTTFEAITHIVGASALEYSSVNNTTNGSVYLKASIAVTGGAITVTDYSTVSAGNDRVIGIMYDIYEELS